MKWTLALVVTATMAGLSGCASPGAAVSAEPPEQLPPRAAPAEKRAPQTTQTDVLSGVLASEEVKHQRALTLYNLAIERAEKALQEAQWDTATLRANEAASVVDENREALWGTEITELRDHAAKVLAAAQARRQLSSTLRSAGPAQSAALTPRQLAAEVAAAEKRKQIRTLREDARTFADSRRYIEAIDSLKALLAIDPQDTEARIELRRLEDITSFRTYDQLRRQQSREASGTGLESKESLVPYGDTVTYPSDWVEKSGRRK